MLYMPFFILNINQSIYATNDKLVCTIKDTIPIYTSGNKLDLLEIELSISNKSNQEISFNKLSGITESMLDVVNIDSCFYSNPNIGVGFRYAIFNNQIELIYYPLGIGDFVYFSKRGSLEYVYLEGIDNPKKVKRQLKKYLKNREMPTTIKLKPHEEIKFKIKIYLGNFYFQKGGTYRLMITYSEKGINSNSLVCFKSNIAVLVVK